jgi:tripartite ATP-independent transporter DctM subunit
MALIAVLLLIAFFFLGTPIFAAILAATMLGFYYAGIDLSAIAVELYRVIDTPLLVSLPFFTFAGYVLSESQTSQRLMRLSTAIFGWVPNGLAIVVLITCAIFTAFTGASGVTILALGALLYPAMVQTGYQQKFSLGLVTTSGSLGLLLPPSIPLILYGIIMQQMNIGGEFDFEQIFLAGLLPGVFMILVLSLWAFWANRHHRIPTHSFSGKEVLSALRESIWEIPLPIFVFAGIFGGILAVSEVAAVTALYVLIVEVFIYKEIKIRDLPKVVTESMSMVGGIILILGTSMAFTNYLIDAEVPGVLFEWVKGHVDDKLTFLLLLNVFLLILGAVLDIFSALVIVVPLILPIAVGYGIHPLHLGVIFLANMQIGYFTPPVGMNLFIASYRFEKSIIELYQACIPFMFVLMAAVLIITYWPQLTLFLIE